MRISMTLLKIILIADLIFNVAMTFTIINNSNNSLFIENLTEEIVPYHYEISFKLDIKRNSFKGNSCVIFEIRFPRKYLHLKSAELEINNYATMLFRHHNEEILQPKKHNYYKSMELLEIYFDSQLIPGNYTLYMEITGIIAKGKHGFFSTDYADTRGYVHKWLHRTQFAPVAARRTFPCWDEPKLKTTFNITINHPRSYTVLSNMPIKRRWHEEDGTVWTRFYITPAMSTYLVGVVLTNFTRILNANMNVPCQAQIETKQKFMQDVFERIIQFLVWYTNNSEAIPKMDHVAILNFPIGTINNYGLIIYGEEYLIYDEQTDFSNYKILDTPILATNKTTRQWFYNNISSSSSGHEWLNAGFALFFQLYIFDKVFKNQRMMDFFVVQIQQSALHNEIYYNMDPVCEIYDTAYILPLCIKGPSMMRMLQHLITEKVFRKGISIYLNQFNSTTPDDFWDALQNALNESNPHNDYNIKEVMDSWLKEKHYPVVRLIQKSSSHEDYEITIKQKDILKSDSDAKWWIPITFATQSNPDFSNTTPHFLLKPQDTDGIILPIINKDDWIIINLQQAGYYRVNYNFNNWFRIANYLNSEEYTKIHVLNRAQIIDDAFYFLMEKQLKPSIFFELTKYLKRETDYIAWYPMTRVFSYVSRFLKYPQCASIKLHMSKLLNRLINSITYYELFNDDDVTKLKRKFAIRWACEFGHPKCKEMTSAWLTTHVTNLADPSPWEQWIYCMFVKITNELHWHLIFNNFELIWDKEYSKYLTCIENERIIHNLLEVLSWANPIRQSMENIDRFRIYRSIIENHARKDTILDHLLKSIVKIKPPNISLTEALTEIILTVNSNKQLQQIKSFVRYNPLISLTISNEIERIITAQEEVIKKDVIECKQLFNFE